MCFTARTWTQLCDQTTTACPMGGNSIPSPHRRMQTTSAALVLESGISRGMGTGCRKRPVREKEGQGKRSWEHKSKSHVLPGPMTRKQLDEPNRNMEDDQRKKGSFPSPVTSWLWCWEPGKWWEGVSSKISRLLKYRSLCCDRWLQTVI